MSSSTGFDIGSSSLGKSLPPSYGANTETSPLARKVFARPFRLVFKRTEDQAVTWIEVKSVDGLKTVVDRLGKAELVPVNAHATLSLQLWGLLAEYTGFLRYAGPSDISNAGIQPLGSEQGQLLDDMSALFGGFEPAIEALSAMRGNSLRAHEDSQSSPTYLKDDGVNLTPEGERQLASIVYDSVGDANVTVKMESANAEVLLQDTDAETTDPICEPKLDEDLETLTGYEAEEIGRKVEQAAEGNLEDEEEVDDL